METNKFLKTKELTYEECKSINGGDPGNLLYLIGYVISWWINLQIDFLKAGVETLVDFCEGAADGWEECPVHVWEWN